MDDITSPRGVIAASAARRAQGLRLRTTPELRRAAMDSVLLKVLQDRKQGVAGITRVNVAKHAQCSSGLVGLYYGSTAAMRVVAVNMLAAQGDSPALRRVFEDGYDDKTKGLKLPAATRAWLKTKE